MYSYAVIFKKHTPRLARVVGVEGPPAESMPGVSERSSGSAQAAARSEESSIVAGEQGWENPPIPMPTPPPSPIVPDRAPLILAAAMAPDELAEDSHCNPACCCELLVGGGSRSSALWRYGEGTFRSTTGFDKRNISSSVTFTAGSTFCKPTYDYGYVFTLYEYVLLHI